METAPGSERGNLSKTGWSWLGEEYQVAPLKKELLVQETVDKGQMSAQSNEALQCVLLRLCAESCRDHQSELTSLGCSVVCWALLGAHFAAVVHNPLFLLGVSSPPGEAPSLVPLCPCAMSSSHWVRARFVVLYKSRSLVFSNYPLIIYCHCQFSGD